MTIAFVLGNGTSRQAVDLPRLRGLGRIYGCNALHRDFVPDVLVATDRPIAEHIQSLGYALEHEFYTRHPVSGRGARVIPEAYHPYSSGPAALGIALDQGARRVYLLGFDLGANQNQQFNNIYASTEFYKKSGSVPTYTGNWIRQVSGLIQKHPKVEFFRVSGATTARLAELDGLSNLWHLQIAEFRDRINTQKDL